MLRGKCLCEAVKIEIDAPLGPAIACHWSLCRRSTGSAFNPIAAVPAERFRITSGQELVREFSRAPGAYSRVLLALRFAALRPQRRGRGSERSKILEESGQSRTSIPVPRPLGSRSRTARSSLTSGRDSRSDALLQNRRLILADSSRLPISVAGGCIPRARLSRLQTGNGSACLAVGDSGGGLRRGRRRHGAWWRGRPTCMKIKVGRGLATASSLSEFYSGGRAFDPRQLHQ
jgi:hypothetical protein